MLSSIRNEIPRLLILAGPMIVSQLLQMSMGFVDTLMVGRLGPTSLAAVALGGAIYHPMFLICAGVMSAVSPLVSQSHGAGEAEPIGRTVRQAFWLATLLAIPGIVVMWNVGPLLVAVGIEPAVAVQSEGYLRAVSFAFLPGLWYWVLRHFVEALGRPRPIMVITFLGAVTNAGMNWVLMFGKFGFPRLGVVGTGWSTSIVVYVIFIVLVLFVRSQRSLKGYQVFRRIARPDTMYLGRIFRLGVADRGHVWCGDRSFCRRCLHDGDYRNQRTGRSSGRAPVRRFHVHGSARYLVRRDDPRRISRPGPENPAGARVAGYTGIAMAVVVMACFAILFVSLPKPIMGLFLDLADPKNGAVIALGVILFGFAAFFQIFDGVQIVAAGALRGLHDTRVPMMIGFLAYWGVGLTAAGLLAFQFDLGPRGIWSGLVLGLVTAAILLSIRFQHLTSSPKTDYDEDIVDGVRPGGDPETP